MVKNCIVPFLMVLLVASCAQQTPANLPPGNYIGQLPCNNCSAIETLYTLDAAGSITQKTKDNTATTTLKAGNNGVFLAVFEADSVYLKFEAGQLVQTDAGGLELEGELDNSHRFRKLTADFPMDLLFENWLLIAINDTVHPEGAIPQLHFSGFENQLTGFTGCNRVFGPFAVAAANNITIHDLATTKMFCENYALEALFMKALEGNHEIIRTNDLLTLGQLTFKKQ